MKFSEAIDKFCEWSSLKLKKQSVRGYGISLKQLGVYVENCDIEDVKIDHIVKWINLLIDVGYSNNALINITVGLRKFFNFYQKLGHNVLDYSLILVPTREHKNAHTVTEEDYKKILAVIPRNTDPRHIRNLAIINLLWDTGARNGEICSLNVDGLDLEKKKSVIKTEKNRGSRPFREIFWTEQTNKNLMKWIEERKRFLPRMIDKTPLFVGISSSNSGKRFSIVGVAEVLRNYSKKAGLKRHANAHSFRHHLGHDIINKGGSAADVQNILGHASLVSSSVYTRMNDKELENRYRIFKGY